MILCNRSKIITELHTENNHVLYVWSSYTHLIQFYPFGYSQNDSTLAVEHEANSGGIDLSGHFVFNDDWISRVYVRTYRTYTVKYLHACYNEVKMRLYVAIVLCLYMWPNLGKLLTSEFNKLWVLHVLIQYTVALKVKFEFSLQCSQPSLQSIERWLFI